MRVSDKFLKQWQKKYGPGGTDMGKFIDDAGKQFNYDGRYGGGKAQFDAFNSFVKDGYNQIKSDPNVIQDVTRARSDGVQSAQTEATAFSRRTGNSLGTSGGAAQASLLAMLGTDQGARQGNDIIESAYDRKLTGLGEAAGMEADRIGLELNKSQGDQSYALGLRESIRADRAQRAAEAEARRQKGYQQEFLNHGSTFPTGFRPIGDSSTGTWLARREALRKLIGLN